MRGLARRSRDGGRRASRAGGGRRREAGVRRVRWRGRRFGPMTSWIPFLFVLFIVAATVGLGIWATRRSKTAADFFVAGRAVSVVANASAISGEYLSAASFMGVAALVMKSGYDALWYPACYA